MREIEENQAISVDLVPHHQSIPGESHQNPIGHSTNAMHFTFTRKVQPGSGDHLQGLLPMAIMFLLIALILYAYIFCHLVPSMEDNGGLSILGSDRFARQLQVLMITAPLFMASLCRTIFTKPGSIPKGLELDILSVQGPKFTVAINSIVMDKLKALGTSDRKKGMFPRFCRTCLVVKPDRSHHCSVCGVCVLRMDHHCPYVNNCVGENNYKFFMNTLTYACLLTWMITLTMWEGVLLAWEDHFNSISYQVCVGVIYFTNVLLSVLVLIFFCFHLYMISQALTTIELREKMQVMFDTSPYDKGICTNFLNVFSENPISWFLPVNFNHYSIK